MFKNVYYDSYKNEIHLWEIVDGKHKYTKTKHTVEYYVKDKTETSDITDIYGTKVVKKVADSVKSLRELRRATKLYESDIPEEFKFLQKTYKDYEGRVDPSLYNVCIIDIEVAGEQIFPKAELAAYPINLITLNFPNQGKIYTFGSDPYTGNSDIVKNYYHDKNEKQLLEKFIEFWRSKKIDIVTAWNLDFDMGYILKRCENLGIDPNLLSPVGRVEYKNPKRIRVHGITLLDYIALYKKFSFTPQPSYKLENVAMAEVKEGKTKYEGDIFTIWKTDWNLFVEYNIQDTVLIQKMDKKRKFINLAIKLATESLVPIDRCMTTTAIVEGYILKTIHKKNKILPDRPNKLDFDYIEDDDEDDELEGAYVEAHPGFYKWLMSFDVESLYPHMIMMYNISPEMKLSAKDIIGMDESEYIKTPVEGVYYRKGVLGILPEITETIFRERKLYKGLMEQSFNENNESDHEYYDGMQHNRKILINCFHKDTEIMTPDGIKLVRDIKEGDLVYSINPKTLNLEIKPVVGTVKKHYTGQLNVIDSKRFKLRVTPDHNMICIDKENKNINFCKSDEFVSRTSRIPIHNKMKKTYEKYIYINEHIDTTNIQYILVKKMDKRVSQRELDSHFGVGNIVLSDDIKSSPRDIKYITGTLTRDQIDYLIDILGYEVKIKHNRDVKCKKQNVRLDLNKFSSFVGWYLSEGSAYICPAKQFSTTIRGESKKISISQHLSINPTFHSEIVSLAKELFGVVYSNDTRISVNSDIVYSLMVDNFCIGQNKRIYETSLGEKLNLELLQESMYKGDGTKGKNIYTVSMKNPKLKDDYCRLLLELGYIPSVRIDDYHETYTGCYRIIAYNTCSEYRKERNYTKEEYNDYVYCVNVKDNHTVIVGEEGRYNFSGQCLYGVLGNEGFHLYDMENASVVTAGGRELIQLLSNSCKDYLKNYLPKKINKYYNIQNIDVSKYKTQVSIVDTDSAYVNITPYFEQINHGMTFLDFCEDFDSRILKPFFNKLINIYCDKYNIPNKINFKREKIITKMFVQVKKKYVCQIIANEKEIYDSPKIKITGLETKKSDLPGFCKKGLNELIDTMFSGDAPNEESMVDIVRKYQKIHKLAPIEEIAIPKGVKDYKKYSIDFSKGLQFLPSTPIHNRASINHNYIVKKYKLPNREIDDGNKIKYLFINKNNELHQEVIAFDDTWPDKFNELFNVDRDLLFNKTFLVISQRMFDALGFRTISLKENKMGKFLKKN